MGAFIWAAFEFVRVRSFRTSASLQAEPASHDACDVLPGGIDTCGHNSRARLAFCRLFRGPRRAEVPLWFRSRGSFTATGR
jgi:hypothetical protein